MESIEYHVRLLGDGGRVLYETQEPMREDDVCGVAIFLYEALLASEDSQEPFDFGAVDEMTIRRIAPST